MKDLDFDELDRAVNSLIGGDQSQTVEAKEDTGANATAGVPASPVVEPTPTDSVASDNTPALQPLAARRSSGRFMDVVHPSSDMRSSFVPPRPDSREGITIQPSSTPAVEEPVMSTPTPDINSSPVSEEPAVPELVKSDWPDPIEFNKSFNQSAPEVPVETENNETLSLSGNDAPAAEADNNLPPLESPFITDAKVEKRPLGAFADATPTPVEPALPNETPVSEPDIDLSTNAEDNPNNETPMPAELQNDLLSIESSEDTAEVVAPEPLTAAVPTPVVEQPAQSLATETTAPVAITQQYVEQPNTGDKPAGSIFDVDSYHKPIAHPKKKKSGWMMIVWIVLLIVFGIGAGAAFYFYVLPTL